MLGRSCRSNHMFFLKAPHRISKLDAGDAKKCTTRTESSAVSANYEKPEYPRRNGHWDTGWTSGDSGFASRDRQVIFSTPSLASLGPNSLLTSGYKRVLSEGKACEVNYSHLFSAETKNAWSYKSIIHIVEQYSIKHITGLYFTSNTTTKIQKPQIIPYKIPQNEIVAGSHQKRTISVYKYMQYIICAVVTTFRLYLQETYMYMYEA